MPWSWLLTPLTNFQTHKEVLFNQMHAHTHSTIERTMGTLKEWWVYLHRLSVSSPFYGNFQVFTYAN